MAAETLEAPEELAVEVGSEFVARIEEFLATGTSRNLVPVEEVIDLLLDLRGLAIGGQL